MNNERTPLTEIPSEYIEFITDKRLSISCPDDLDNCPLEHYATDNIINILKQGGHLDDHQREVMRTLTEDFFHEYESYNFYLFDYMRQLYFQGFDYIKDYVLEGRVSPDEYLLYVNDAIKDYVLDYLNFNI